MTGKHAGHASIRANDGGTPLRENETTIASMLKNIGYETGGFGKWGCGGRDSTGVPEKHGFDLFYGYYDQVHAHSFYPSYLIRNSIEVELKGNKGGRSGQTYSHYQIMEAGLSFIREKKDKPFFCISQSLLLMACTIFQRMIHLGNYMKMMNGLKIHLYHKT